MVWVISIIIILIALILLFILKGREVTYSGSRNIIYYVVIALMIVLLIISIVAWYTAPVNPKAIKKPPVSIFISNMKFPEKTFFYENYLC